jgi:hypothetical protein
VESRERGDQVVDALKRYYESAGDFPRSLDELIPKYVEGLPTPTAGSEDWVYLPSSDRKHFTLRFLMKWTDVGEELSDSCECWHLYD